MAVADNNPYIDPVFNVQEYMRLRDRYRKRVERMKGYMSPEDYLEISRYTFAPSSLMTRKEFEAASTAERKAEVAQIQRVLKYKSTTKTGYKEIKDRRFQAMKEKIPDLTKGEFDILTSDFNELKKKFDSQQMILDFKEEREAGHSGAALMQELKSMLEELRQKKHRRKKGESDEAFDARIAKEAQKKYDRYSKKLRKARREEAAARKKK